MIVSILALSFLAGCTEDNDEFFISYDTNYYPIQSGNYNIYDVTEITIDAPSDVYDTTNYQIKEMIGGKYTDNAEKTAYLFLRYTRSDTNAPWHISDVWTLQLTDDRLFLTEENHRLVKMYFPLSLDKSWDGNAYNELDAMEYTVTGLDEPASVNQHSFDSALTITQEADSSLIHKSYSIEKYARDTGMIYKEITELNSQEIEPGVPLEDRITTGNIYKQWFVENGEDEDYYTDTYIFYRQDAKALRYGKNKSTIAR
ncbi:MAG: hypothetical protein U9Q98_05445 [Bacteroidota bacterium]|nr:hypothetical protein [Bacteroidota bacterium]